jgi:hypothetical protein
MRSSSKVNKREAVSLVWFFAVNFLISMKLDKTKRDAIPVRPDMPMIFNLIHLIISV